MPERSWSVSYTHLDVYKRQLVSTAEYGKAEKTYYAYGCGRLQGICNSAGEAIRLIYDQMGVVVDDKGDYIWTRANRAMQYSICLLYTSRCV